MKIELICNDGSPIGVIPPYIHGRGVGGAEMAMLSLTAAFAKRGHEVIVYNDPESPGDYDGVVFRPLAEFSCAAAKDALIVFRSPNPRVEFSRLGSTVPVVWWSTDQYTIGDFAGWSRLVDRIVTISPYHKDFLARTYGIPPEKMRSIDLGVRVEDYDQDVPKVRGRCLYASVPDRGLMILHAAWPLIKRTAPEANLVITSDYTLWGNASPGNHEHRLNWAGLPDVSFLGKVSRAELVRLQLEAEILSYPCTYEELFCLSIAEAQVAGALPVTTPIGAIPTTAEHGIIIAGIPTNPDFVERYSGRIASLLTEERHYLETRIPAMRLAARKRFDWDAIAGEWETVLEPKVA